MDKLNEFAEYAQARQGHLRRLAFLMCGDWHEAQDLTQTALLNLCRHWKRVRRADSVDAYAHKVLVHAVLSDGKKRERDKARARDFALAADRDQASRPASQTELRLTLLSALDRIGPRGRAVLVLRYWEDLSVEATAAALDCSIGNVKSQSSRALARLREILGDSLLDGIGDSAGHEAPTSPGNTSMRQARPATETEW